MLATCIIPCLDVKDGRTVKGVNFVDLRDAGDPVALAKAYADLAAQVLASGSPVSWSLILDAWSHGRTTLIAVNLPTLAFLGGAVGIFGVQEAFVLAQISAIGLLIYYGARIGFRLTGRVVPMVVGGAFPGGIGLALSFLKTLLP